MACSIQIHTMTNKVLEAAHKFSERLDKELGVPEGFLFGLPGEDEWSFVVKVAAIVEASVSELLLATIADNRLHPIFSKMRLRGPDGKIAYLTALELLSKEQIAFIDQLYLLRNSVVHDIKQVSFVFENYFGALPTERVKSFWSAIVPQRDVRMLVADPKNCRFVIWLSLLNFLASMQTAKAKQKGDRELQGLRMKMHEEAYELVRSAGELSELEADGVSSREDR